MAETKKEKEVVTPVEGDDVPRTEYDRVVGEYDKLVKAFNKLLREYNELHIKALLGSDSEE